MPLRVWRGYSGAVPSGEGVCVREKFGGHTGMMLYKEVPLLRIMKNTIHVKLRLRQIVIVSGILRLERRDPCHE